MHTSPRRVEEVKSSKKDFIQRVSHELKAPSASMLETTQLMIERIPGPLTQKQERLMHLNIQSGKRLARMIGNILDLSSAQRHNLGGKRSGERVFSCASQIRSQAQALTKAGYFVFQTQNAV